MRRTFLTLMGALLLSSAFADNSCDPCNKPCEPCEPCPAFCPPPPPCVCAYNAPYGIDVRCGWDLFVTGSFLYWKAAEENLEYGDLSTNTNPSGTGNNFEFNDQAQEMGFEYKPGFKVGLGLDFDYDNWELYAEYTYLHSTISNSTTVNPEDLSTTTIHPSWVFNLGSVVNLFNSDFTEASAKWNVKLDIGDLELARQYYVGRHLTFRTFASLRAAWIRQTYTATYDNENNPTNLQISIESTSKTRSWGIGPRMGVDTKWLFCEGFRLFADASASILFTKYTTDSIDQLATQATAAGAPNFGVPFDVTSTYSDNKHLCFLRPQAEMTIGAGWGDYFFCNKWFFDVEVGYTFNVFWNQNMFHRNITSNGPQPHVGDGIGRAFIYFDREGDLYFHGLTVTARLEF